MMLRKFHVGIALAVAVAAAPFALSPHGIVLNDGSAANGSTSYFTLQPGTTKTFPMSTWRRLMLGKGVSYNTSKPSRGG